MIAASIEGVDARILSPTETRIDAYTPFIVYMGYYGEFLTFAMLSFILLAFKKWYLQGFPFGAMHATAYLRAPHSYDFTVHASKVLSPRGVEIALNRWYVLVTIVIIIGWLLTIRAIRRENDLSNASRQRQYHQKLS